MRQNIWKSLKRRFARDERGQILVMGAIFMTVFTGFAAVVVDMGRVYYGFNQLVASSNAAALAGAEAISNPTLGIPGNTAPTPSQVATYYSSQTSGTPTPLNVYSHSLQNVVTTPTVSCNTALESSPTSVSCISYNGSGSNTANVIKVVQTAQVHTLFAGMFGAPWVNLTATAYALRAGAQTTPYNVAIVIDSTRSMSENVDSNCSYGASLTRFQCALAGVETLLQNMAPCYSSEGSCGTATNGLTSPSVDRVALFTFPNMTTATIPTEYCAGGSKGTTCASSGSVSGCLNSSGSICVEPYTFPSATGTSYTSETIGSGTSATTVSYMVTYGLGGSDDNGFVSDYKTQSGGTTLNTTGSTPSDLALAVGSSPTSGDMDAVGGAGTYYAGVIYAAEAALYAEQQANPGSQNVLIILSDGDATATGSDFESSNNGYALNTTGTYPSSKDECQQAVTAAGGTIGQNWTPDTSAFTAARASISKIYSIAYGSESGTTCQGDTYTPCQTMMGMASSQNYFYSDYTQSGTGIDTNCVGTNPVSSMSQIFSAISSDFGTARLISPGLYNSGS
jgi:Putative Flp pilus-assembly TadE/G-like